ncbi:MAG: DUF2807 domain-containing protein [Bacteroidales bacterium]|nr:DUF2807 domain-containing protein [Bacteroidales bacterium]
MDFRKKNLLEYHSMMITMVLAFAIFSSCTKQNIDITKEEALQNFSVIHVHRNSEIVLVQDTCYKIVAEGEDRAVENTVWEVKNDTLRIKSRNSPIFRIEEVPRLTLHFPDLTWLTTFKPARIYNTDTLKLNYFYVYSIGEIGELNLVVDCNTFGLDNSANTLGNFFIKGKASLAYLFNRYGSTIYADSLFCREVQVINESVGDVYISASEQLRVYLWSTGNIYYYGNPDISIVEKRNSGELVRLNH